MTAADRTAGVLVALATAFVAWAVLGSGGPMTVLLLLLLAGGSIAAAMAGSRAHARRQPARRLVAHADGSLWLQAAGQAPSRTTIGVGTRLLGPSVFLDLRVESGPTGERLWTWLTPLDVPAAAIRRWSVVLLRCGRPVGA